MKQRAAEDPATARALSDARLFDKLKEDPAWQRLARVVQEKKDGILLGLARRLLAGETAVELQREIDFKRGYIEGIADVLAIPDKVAQQLETQARIALERATSRQLEAEEEQTPYV